MYNIYIRPLKIEDALISYKWRNDSDIWTYTGSRPDKEITWKIENKWLENVLKDQTTKRFAIIVDDIYVGNIQLTNIKDKSADYHIFIGDKNYHGKGISKIATFQILYYAKNILKLESINLEVREDNVPAIKLYKNFGFKEFNRKDKWVSMTLSTDNLVKPTVSIFVMVYNHGSYLRDCLDGFLKQKTNFNVNIIVGEDYSTDNSRKILLEYQNNFCGKFNLLLHDKNIGAHENQQIVLDHCDGKYIAMCEGDDYWTDPLKLQKQVDFLENNDECNLVYHRVNIKDEEKNIIYPEELNTSEKIEVKNLDELALNGNFMHTPSVMFRNNIKFDHEYSKSKVGDYILWFLNGTKGDFGYLPDIMAVYRFSTQSTWGKKDAFFRISNWLDVLKIAKKISNKKTIRENIKKQAWSKINELDIKSLTVKEKLILFSKLIKIEPKFIKRICQQL